MLNMPLIIFILLTYSFVNCDLLSDKIVRDDYNNTSAREYESKQRMSENRKWITEIFDEVKYQFSMDGNVTEYCRKDYLSYRQHLRNHSIWAIRMLESSEWPTMSVFAGTSVFMGNWFECRLVSSNGIDGQFCFANATYDYSVEEKFEVVEWPSEESSVWNAIKMYHKDPIRVNRQMLKWGLCIPSSCTSGDLKKSLNDHLKPVFEKHGIIIDVDVDPVMCSRRIATPKPSQFFYFWYFIIVILGLIISSTVYDLNNATDNANSLRRKVFTVFSFTSNSKSLTKSSPLIQCAAHSVKALAMVFALYAHLTYYILMYPKSNAERIEWDYKSMPIGLGHSALTDIFLLVSGFLAFDYGIKEVSKGGVFYLLLSLICRWIRMCVPFGIVIYFVIHVLPYLGDGPLWNYYVLKEVDNCRENWWASVFGVANIFGVEKQCLVISWYISVDLHLTIIAYCLLYLINKNRKIGAVATGFVFFSGMIITFVVVYVRRLDAVFMFYMSSLEDPRKSDNFNFQYIATYSRVTSYFTGFISAFFADFLNKRNYQFPMIIVRTVPFLGIILSECYQFYAYLFYRYGRKYNAIENSIYASTHRWIFVAPIAFGLCCIATSKIDTFFESLAKAKMNRILGRLSLSTFLLNIIVLLYFFSIQTNVITTSVEFNLYWAAASQFLFSVLFAFLFYVIIEAPVFNLIKILIETIIILTRSSKKSIVCGNGATNAGEERNKFNNGAIKESFVYTNGRIQEVNVPESTIVRCQ